MSLNDRFAVTIAGSYDAATWYNVFHYTQTSSPGSAGTLDGVAQAYLVPALATVMQESAAIEQVAVINLDDDTDYSNSLLSPVVDGTRTGEGEPSWMAWVFRYTRVSRGNHHGRKAIAGVSESDHAGRFPTSGMLTVLAAAAAVFAADLVGGGGETYAPKIFRAPNSIKPDYNNALELLPIAGVSFAHISTQKSRQP